ncbi:DUF19 domain-containing protein [Caenorhabditis elegans]|uniref:DUF19 domain-containing protein n=1 Tax=Caenorhabditis elegans TaxID=6239 RepID=Q18632_CAEEL|nr:DUF19 domain-containing protein [Caenorhabditis elegans]CAA99785.1 DUF19 domain-containing protein [Caenorhabditis elegans]|eukprot:NP_001023707.1 Uncharacterized protein CELE_C44H9.7 [Caenorhabditis elegans]
MYLTSLALLQVLGLPQNFTFYPLNNPFSIEYQSWQCQNLPSIYTQKYLKTKCPGLIGDLNVCCAVLNECLEQETENATCLTKYSTCTTAVFSLSHPSDLVACIRFPSDVLNNFANITVQPIPQIPKLRFITNNSSGSHELLEHCPNRSRTITTCLNNFQDEVTNMKKANPNSEKSQAFASVFGVAKLRARLEMFLRSENGKKCGNGIQDFLNNLEKSVSYKNKVAKMQDESLWKCGSNLLDNYASQVILGTKCYWLKGCYQQWIWINRK